jgi:hypothetical protein
MGRFYRSAYFVSFCLYYYRLHLHEMPSLPLPRDWTSFRERRQENDAKTMTADDNSSRTQPQ